MKPRRQCSHDPHDKVRKYDRLGKVRPEWEKVYQKKKRPKGRS